jgi:hypothetical protein
MRGKLNLFQATMLRWRDLHPYSAVHVVRVMQRCDVAKLQTQISKRLEDAGLTGLLLNRKRFRFEFAGGGAEVELKVLDAGADPREALRLEIVRQLNTPFPREGRFSPFRFFAIDSGAFFDLGLAYDHFIAGGDSIAVLLEHCLAGYGKDDPDEARPWTPRLYPQTYGRLFLSRIGAALAGLGYLRQLAASARRTFRAPCKRERDAGNGFLCYRVDPAVFERLRQTAKTWAVTLNDLMLAVLLVALDPVAVGRETAVRRRELGVASIVNLRAELESDARATFGQFLSSLRFSHPVPRGVGLKELAAAVHVESSRVLSRKLYLQSLLALGISGLMWPWLSSGQRRCFLAKHYPIWAGLTALRVDPLWDGASGGAQVSEYLRAVSTGPLSPLVFAVTTLRETMWLGVSFRACDVDAATAERVAQEFLRRTASLE